MNWIDAHCHVDTFDPAALEALVERARAAGLVRAVAVGQWQAPGDFGKALAAAESHPDFFSATMGIHPHEAANVPEEDWAALERLCRREEVLAVGEAGLDYYYQHSPKAQQREAFARQCQLARAVDKPLVVHVRDAHEECDALLEEQGVRRGVIHCFTGDTVAARRYLDRGFLLSLSGIVTYKKTEALQEAVRFAPLERLMVETDSPYLAPVPFRGKRNEPAWVVEVAKKVAELKGLTLEEVSGATTDNARRLFGLPAA
ncbi:MAG TPA: TatD family hydrolase [Myxococcaceae bacterium]|nr:TatD family hydrolase [Myxococcaceae bacterium]